MQLCNTSLHQQGQRSVVLNYYVVARRTLNHGTATVSSYTESSAKYQLCTAWWNWLHTVMTFVEWLNIWGAMAFIAQACSQVLRFGEAKYIFRGRIFVLIVCLKQIFLGTT